MHRIHVWCYTSCLRKKTFVQYHVSNKRVTPWANSSKYYNLRYTSADFRKERFLRKIITHSIPTKQMLKSDGYEYNQYTCVVLKNNHCMPKHYFAFNNCQMLSNAMCLERIAWFSFKKLTSKFDNFHNHFTYCVC